jgi:hypothetical protein
MGSDKTEVWNVTPQRGLGISPETNQKSIDNTHDRDVFTLGIYFFFIPVILRTRRI